MRNAITMASFAVICLSLLSTGQAVARNEDRGAYLPKSLVVEGGVPRLGGVSALLPFPDSGFPSVDKALLSNPEVDGITVRVYWREFYKRQDDPNSPIQWGPLDDIFAQAAGAGKFVRIAIAPGFYSPAWVINSVPVLMLPVPEGPLHGTQPLPLPWDETYLADWLNFIDQFAARYGDNPNLSWISVVGPNSHNDEVNLPHYDPAKNQPSTKSVWLQAAADAGISGESNQLQWLLGKLEQAYFRCIDRFNAAFGSRGKHYTIALIHRSFPVENEPQLEQVYEQDLISYGATHYPNSLGVQNNGLNGEPLCSGNSGPDPVWMLIGIHSSTLFTGFQTEAPGNLYCDTAPPSHSMVLRNVIDTAIQYQAHFLEIYSSDILDPDLASDIAYAHGQLGPPDTLTLELAKQKASGKLAVYVTSTDPAATLNITATPLAGSPIDLGTMAKTDPNGNEFFLIRKGFAPVGSVQITSTSRGSLTVQLKGH
jgi:hypothetical protein